LVKTLEERLFFEGFFVSRRVSCDVHNPFIEGMSMNSCGLWSVIRIGSLALALCGAGCRPGPSAALPTVTARQAEHAQLAALPNRTSEQEAQLLLWQECQDRYYTRLGIDQTTYTLREEAIPIQCKWSFDDKCTRLELVFKWDARLTSTEEIEKAIEAVLGDMHFIQSSLPQLLESIHQARDNFKLQQSTQDPASTKVVTQLAVPDSSALFHLESLAASENSVTVDIATRAQHSLPPNEPQ
jgi:hypothetical protein